MSTDDYRTREGEIPPKRFPWTGLLVILVLAGGAAAIYFMRSKPDFRGVTATSGRLTLADEKGDDLKSVDRREGLELWYRVTLVGVPEGSKVPLTCEWIAPNRQVVHRNRYETKPVDSAPWPTHARYRLEADAPTGTWTVRLLLEGRTLHSKRFQVRDGP